MKRTKSPSQADAVHPAEVLPSVTFDATERALDKLEPAWADFAHGARTGLRHRRDTPGTRVLQAKSLEDVHHQLEAYRERFQSGDPIALLHGLVLALTEVVPVPYWIATQVQDRIERVASMEDESPLTLHDAFELSGVIPTSVKRWRQKRQEIAVRAKLWSQVAQLMRVEGLALNPAIRRVLATREYPMVGPTRARALFLEQDSIQRQLLGQRSRTRNRSR